MRALSIIVLASLVAACSVGPDYERPEIETPDAWQYSFEEMADVANTAWWSGFNDPVLDQLVEQALESNLDVRIAAARIEQFAARLNIARSDYYPQIGYGASGSRRGIKEEVAVPGFNDTITDNYQATLNVGWELDICAAPVKPLAPSFSLRKRYGAPLFLVWCQRLPAVMLACGHWTSSLT